MRRKNKYILQLDEKLFIASPIWSERLEGALPLLWVEVGPAGLSGHASSSCRLDVSRGGNKMQRASSEGLLLEKGVTERRSESGSPMPCQML